MPTLLEIDSSPLGDASISRHLAADLVRNWELANPTGRVIVRALAAPSTPPVTAAWVGPAHTPENALPLEQRNLPALSDTLIAELQTADEYVFGVPMHNFSIPA